MSKTLKVRIITPERQVFDGDAVSVQYPGEDGLYGVLPGHAPMVTTVDIGVLKVRDEAGNQSESLVTRGFCEVRDNEVHLAVDSAEDVAMIDVDRARQAAERARERLQDKVSEVDLVRATYSLRRALMRLGACGSRR